MTGTVVPLPFCHTGRVLHADPDFVALAGDGWADRIMSAEVLDRYHAKQGRSIGRWALAGPDGRTLTVYLKRHYELSATAGRMARLFPGKAWSPGLQEWEHLKWAASVGLPVPRAVAAGEFRGPGCRLQSFLAVEELADMLPLHEAIPLASDRQPAADFDRWKRGLVTELARLTRELHRRRAFHKDLYLCHFYIPVADLGRVPDNFAGRVFVIDFHRLGRHRGPAAGYYQVKDLAQLLYSTHDVAGLTETDRVRFWRAYRGGDWGPTRPPGTWLRTAVRWKWKLYRRHNDRRRTRTGGGA